MSDNGMTKNGGITLGLVNNTDARVTGAMHIMLVAHAEGPKLNRPAQLDRSDRPGSRVPSGALPGFRWGPAN
jgi:hypothetical protein